MSDIGTNGTNKKKAKKPAFRLRDILKTDLAQRMLAWAIATYIQFVGVTSRFEHAGPGYAALMADVDAGRAGVLAFWHGRILMMGLIVERAKRERAHVLISRHGDGEIIARAMAPLGISTVRGSPKKGAAAAVIALREVMRGGGFAVITPDGPRGPRMVASGGAVTVARYGKGAIYPAAFSVRRGITLGTWDRLLFVWPFTRGIYIVGDPITVPPNADEATLEACRKELEARLNAAITDADRRMGRTPVVPGTKRKGRRA